MALRPSVVSLVVCAAVACSDTNDPSESASDAGTDAASHEHDHGDTDGNGIHQLAFPSCQQIMDACHWLDQGRPGRINDCHDLALDAKDDASCAARLTECLDVCNLRGSDPSDASTD